MVNFSILMDKIFISNCSNEKMIKENSNEVSMIIKSFNIIAPYHKISYSLFKGDFLETCFKILELSLTINNNELINECLNLFLNFSEHSFSVEQNCDLLINKLYKQILLLTQKLNSELKRYPLKKALTYRHFEENLQYQLYLNLVFEYLPFKSNH